MAHPVQLELQPRTWGGRRSGAGRKPSGRKVGVPHRIRPAHVARHPVHVTLRAARSLPSLRGDRLFEVLRRGLAPSSQGGLRILHFSVQTDHVHMIVEAESGGALSRGLQGLAIRLAKRVNRVLGRAGSLWSDRYHARPLRTPREVRNAVVYVLQNWRHHRLGGEGVDPCSSGRWFDAWAGNNPSVAGTRPVVTPRTWLAAVGWRRYGSIKIEGRPATRSEKRPPSRCPRLQPARSHGPP